MSSFVHHLKAIGEFKLELQSGNAQFGSKLVIFFPCDLKIWWMKLENNRAPLPCHFKLSASFHSHLWIQNGVTVWKHQIWVKISDFFVLRDLESWLMTSKKIGHLKCYFKFCASFHSDLWIKKWSYSPETSNLGQNRQFFVLCDLAIWRMTLKNNRAPPICHFKLCASFHSHPSVKTGVTARKQLSWVFNSVTLTLDLWPWSFAWISLLSLVITPENFMMIRWWKHSEKGVTDGPTDRQTDGQMERSVLTAAWSQLKTHLKFLKKLCQHNSFHTELLQNLSRL